MSVTARLLGEEEFSVAPHSRSGRTVARTCFLTGLPAMTETMRPLQLLLIGTGGAMFRVGLPPETAWQE
jgi:hypothetical protein